MFKLARKIFCYYLNKDEDLRKIYKDDIALYINDNLRLSRKECNKVADGLLEYLFKN